MKKLLVLTIMAFGLVAGSQVFAEVGASTSGCPQVVNQVQQDLGKSAQSTEASAPIGAKAQSADAPDTKKP